MYYSIVCRSSPHTQEWMHQHGNQRCLRDYPWASSSFIHSLTHSLAHTEPLIVYLTPPCSVFNFQALERTPFPSAAAHGRLTDWVFVKRSADSKSATDSGAFSTQELLTSRRAPAAPDSTAELVELSRVRCKRPSSPSDPSCFSSCRTRFRKPSAQLKTGGSNEVGN